MTSAQKNSFKGKVIRQKIIKALDPTLVYVELEIKGQNNLKALVGKQPLSFIMDVELGDTISVFGHYNSKNQFIIDKYLNAQSTNKYHSPDLPNHLRYPHHKTDK